MRLLANLAAGFIFGLGLLISGMANPAKVQNFLDLAGSFDPSLIFVMAGAVIVTFIGYRLVLRRTKPVLGEVFRIPARNDVDAALIAGPALLGIGWALSGYCPGPAITSIPLLATGHAHLRASHDRGYWARAPSDPCVAWQSGRAAQGLAFLGEIAPARPG